MTEKQWLSTPDPIAMMLDQVAWMRLKRSRRKERLCSCACCFALGDSLSNKTQRSALLASERYADGLIKSATLGTWWTRMNTLTNRARPKNNRETAEVAICRAVAWACKEDRFFERHNTIYTLCNSKSGLKSSVREPLRPVVAGIIRDIFGNPFRKITFNKKWRTDTAVSLARAMYDSREFSAMPILADALQDAGCDNEDVLSHCRDANQVHVRGCWVVDVVLEKT